MLDPMTFIDSSLTPDGQPIQEIPRTLSVLPLHGIVIYPFMMTPVLVSDPAECAMILEAEKNEIPIAAFTSPAPADVGQSQSPSAPQPLAIDMAPSAPESDHPQTDDATGNDGHNSVRLYTVGTAVNILKTIKIPDGSARVMLHGMQRVRLTKIVQKQPHIQVNVHTCESFTVLTSELRMMTQSAKSLLKKLGEIIRIPEDVIVAAHNQEDPGILADMIASNLSIQIEERQRILEIIQPQERLQVIMEIMNREMQIGLLGDKIQSRVQRELEQGRREYYLREQLKAIKKELGEADDLPVEIREFRERIDQADLPEEPQKVAEREWNRLQKMNPSAGEYTVAATYLDWILSLPWRQATHDRYNLKRAARILEQDHYGLEKVKERILEHLAVMKLRGNVRGSVLCFLGPPGVGKTSLGQSIARALGRKFHRFSVGGMRDEAELRGHRRTYIGALPGRIVKALRDCGENNPVVMLDEIDKIGSDYRGDPAAALLEILDPEQNHHYVDNYLDMPVDLSNVIFLTTANNADAIPSPLLDRMEIISLSGYTTDEKIHIARKYLVPRQLKEAGLSDQHLRFTTEGLRLLIESYTREAGVRNLARAIGSVCRKVARKVAEGTQKKETANPKRIAQILGPHEYIRETTVRAGVPGVATGLAWSPTGGELLFIETASTPGQGRLTVTGRLGEIMKESVQAALSYLNANHRELDLPPVAFTHGNFHVHVPAGAVPKDGPSAGMAICAALYSLLRDTPFPTDVALTGEISLTGRILPIGGLKEKVLAAHRLGIRRIIAPFHNQKNLENIPPEVRKEMTFLWVKDINETLHALFPDEFKEKEEKDEDEEEEGNVEAPANE